MGAKYAPSVANLYMAEWEDDILYNNKPQQLLLFKRFIDDIIVIWAGDRESLMDFCFNLNTNNKNIRLTWEINDEKIHFLDLEILIEDGKLVTQTFFKQVDGNSYLPLDSCHHAPWLNNIPTGQFIRLKRNCTKQEVFLNQAEFIGESFIQKGYRSSFIKERIKDIEALDRSRLIEDSTRDKDSILRLLRNIGILLKPTNI